VYVRRYQCCGPGKRYTGKSEGKLGGTQSRKHKSALKTHQTRNTDKAEVSPPFCDTKNRPEKDKKEETLHHASWTGERAGTKSSSSQTSEKIRKRKKVTNIWKGKKKLASAPPIRKGQIAPKN